MADSYFGPRDYLGRTKDRSRRRSVLEKLSTSTADDDELERLKKTIGTKEKGGGFLGSLGNIASDVVDVAGGAMDILARPNYAVAEFADRLVSLIEGEGETASGSQAASVLDVFEGLVGGLAGENKTSFIDVLNRMDEAGPFGAIKRPISQFPGGEQITGFAADVVLDPLNLVGIGPVVKGARGLGNLSHIDDISKVGGQTSKLLGRAAESSDEAIRKTIFAEVHTPTAITRRAQEATQQAISDAGGTQAWAAIPRKQKDKIIKQINRDLLDRDYENIASGIRAEQAVAKPQLGIRVGLPSVRRNLRSTRGLTVPIPGLREFVDLTGTNLKKIPAIRALSRTFRTDEAYGVSYQQTGRVIEAAAAGNFELATRTFRKDVQKILKRAGRDLDEMDQELIAKSIDSGSSTGVPELDEIADYVRGTFDSIAARELNAGLLKPSEVLPNYFPHYYKGEVSDGVRRRVRARRRQRVGTPAAGPRSVQDAFKYADEAGLKVVTNLDEAMTRRLGEHFETMARYEFLSEVKRLFGVSVGTRINNKGKKVIAGGKLNKERVRLLRSKGYQRLSKVWDTEPANMHRYLGNLEQGAQVWVPPETVDALKSLRSIALSDTDAAYFGKLHRQVLSAIKSNLTIWRPAFHVRNLRGDIQLNALDGMVGPRAVRAYGTATKLLAANMDRSLTGAIPGSLVGRSKALEEMSVKINEHLTLRGDQVYDMFINSGAKSGFIAYEMGGGIRARTPIGKASRKLRAASEVREDIPRLAHFIHVLQEDKTARSLDDLFDKSAEAGARVRKFNIDYGDLTDAEKRLKNIFPFYTWFRKNMPLQLEMMFTRPGVQAAYAKAYNFVDEVYGEDQDTIVPKWLSELTPVQVRRTGMDKVLSGVLSPIVPGAAANLVPGEDATFVTGQSVPLVDALSNLQPLAHLAQGDVSGAAKSASRTVTEMLSPLITAPLEIGSGRSFFTGGPVDPGRSLMDLMPFTQIPGMLSEAAGGDPVGTQQLLNFLAASDLQVVDETRQLSELRRREDILDAKIRARKSGMGEEAFERFQELNLGAGQSKFIFDRLMGNG